MAAYSSKINIRMYTNIFLLVYMLFHFFVLFVAYEFNIGSALFDSLATVITLFALVYLIQTFEVDFFDNKFGVISWLAINIIITLIVVEVLQSALDSYLYQDTNYIQWTYGIKTLRGLLMWVILSHLTSLHFLISDHSEEKEEIERTQYNERLVKDAELFKLRQQINPHFLFNTLNSINALVGAAPERARDMIQQLSMYFRNSLKKEEHNWIPIAEEVEDIRLYFEIEKVRFGHRLVFFEQIEDQCWEALVPPFLFQPLVENAIKYGLYGTTKNVEIQYKLFLNTSDRGNQYLIFSISNPFDADTPQVSGTGFGLKSVQRRLYLLFGRNDLLLTQIEDIPGDEEMKKFTAYISIPYTVPTKNMKHD